MQKRLTEFMRRFAIHISIEIRRNRKEIGTVSPHLCINATRNNLPYSKILLQIQIFTSINDNLKIRFVHSILQLTVFTCIIEKYTCNESKIIQKLLRYLEQIAPNRSKSLFHLPPIPMN